MSGGRPARGYVEQRRHRRARALPTPGYRPNAWPCRRALLDLVGARQVGMTIGWAPRLDGGPPPLFGSVGDSFDAVIDARAALPAKR